MPLSRRRDFLKMSAAAAALPLPLRDAFAIPARRITGSIKDVQHVVILMQENRSFDHYFGSLRGVRGFGDPRPLTWQNGKSVFHQPHPRGGVVAPFHLDSKGTNAQFMASLDHSWKGSQARWQDWDAWIDAKTPMTMGYFTRADLPFYYALADAFTICDAYHCSIFGPTSPNRMFLFSGSNGLSAGMEIPDAVTNSVIEVNETADPANDSARFTPYGWTTYAERLQHAGIDWKVYQEFDNYGDNELAYFKAFRGLDPSDELYRRGRAWVDGANAGNAKTSRGEHLIAAFARDVAADRLPQVSWIVAPYIMCEHPAAPPGYGEQFTSGLICALASNPEVWAKTVFILTYDENDGFFDHVPPLVPPKANGISTADTMGEFYHGEPVGFGPRVPMMVVSPWTRGGWVNSQLFDHTSIIRFLERRFGVEEPNISPWRRAMAGDLTSVFDFADPDGSAALPDGHDRLAVTDESKGLAKPVVPAMPQTFAQEAGQRAARPLPYALDVTGRADGGAFEVEIANRGAAGAGLTVYHAGEAVSYAVEAGKHVRDRLLFRGTFHFTAHGPNGFLRRWTGGAGSASQGLRVSLSHKADMLVLSLYNESPRMLSVAVTPNAYWLEPAHRHDLQPGARIEDRWSLSASDHWYDLSVTAGEEAGYLCRLAGHIETGRPSRSDPAMGKIV
ncbi:MAG: phospholipase C, phosphocholine-specific [Alphaproteobacteria bacterium]|nr:phospholipase C, phosphocholine-specific [Alphaproteobacteria bacterium]